MCIQINREITKLNNHFVYKTVKKVSKGNYTSLYKDFEYKDGGEYKLHGKDAQNICVKSYSDIIETFKGFYVYTTLREAQLAHKRRNQKEVVIIKLAVHPNNFLFASHTKNYNKNQATYSQVKVIGEYRAKSSKKAKK